MNKPGSDSFTDTDLLVAPEDASVDTSWVDDLLEGATGPTPDVDAPGHDETIDRLDALVVAVDDLKVALADVSDNITRVRAWLAEVRRDR